MTDITLPREVVKNALHALEDAERNHDGDQSLYTQEREALRAALAAEQPRHPDYVIGNHWLETAYSRICAGEAEADVLRDIGLIREEAFLTGVQHLRHENERLREALEIIAGCRQCVDSLMGNQDVAIAALRRED